MRLLATVFLCALALALPHAAKAQGLAADRDGQPCQSLQKETFLQIPDAPTSLISSTLVAASGDVPAFCRVVGYVNPSTGIELNLPVANWNGKFAYLGCGSSCGSTIQTASCDGPMRRGYACIAGDMGHRAYALDNMWAYENLQAKVDFAFRSTHLATVAGKAIAARFYGRPPIQSYFLGCSTGGRQALMEAQKFPYDYDGVVFGAPPLSQTGAGMALLWSAEAVLGGGGRAILSRDDFERLHAAVLARCDMDDGARDGIVGAPQTCRFNPADLLCKAGQSAGCFSAAQVAAIAKIYGGPVTSKGVTLTTGRPMPGSELGWANDYLASDSGPALVEGSLTGMFKYRTLAASLAPPPTRFDWDADYQRLALQDALDGATNPDLRVFKAHGGKLIGFHGWTDTSVMPTSSVDYYETVTRTMGGAAQTADFFRLFMLPGVDHCGNGAGADKVDYFAAIEAWVEQGKAPDVLLAAHERDAVRYATTPNYWAFRTIDPSRIDFTRPVYPYPIGVRYKGTGNPNDAASFAPVGKAKP